MRPPKRIATKNEITKAFESMCIKYPLSKFVRILPVVHASTPLGYGKNPSRFSPLNGVGEAATFGIIYGTTDFQTACFEAIVRDVFSYRPKRRLRKLDYKTKCAINISSKSGSDLSVLDLTNGNSVRYGVPTDVVRHSNHMCGQLFSEFIYINMKGIDGLLYNSRFTEQRCIAIYDRAIHKIQAVSKVRTLDRNLLETSLSTWNIHVS